MIRIIFGAGIGGVLGLLILPVWGAYYGAVNGSPRLPPGGEAAATEALFFTADYWWSAIPVGAFAGGLLGLVICLVKWAAVDDGRIKAA